MWPRAPARSPPQALPGGLGTCPLSSSLCSYISCSGFEAGGAELPWPAGDSGMTGLRGLREQTPGPRSARLAKTANAVPASEATAPDAAAAHPTPMPGVGASGGAPGGAGRGNATGEWQWEARRGQAAQAGAPAQGCVCTDPLPCPRHRGLLRTGPSEGPHWSPRPRDVAR